MVGQAPFQAPHCLVVGFAGRDFGVVVGPPGTARHSCLGERDDVQCEVELSVAAARQPVADSFGAGNLDRGDAGIASEGRCGSESAHPTGAGQQPTGDDRPNTVDLDQVAAGGGDRLSYLSGENLQPLVGLANL
jgi:hypothetical protein